MEILTCVGENSVTVHYSIEVDKKKLYNTERGKSTDIFKGTTHGMLDRILETKTLTRKI